MSSLGSYRIMKPLKDEDRWFKFFTKRQLLFVIVGIVLSSFVYPFFSKLGLRIVGIILVEIIMLSMLVLAFLKLPYAKYLIGGGRYVHEILMRLLVKKLPKNRVIYTKNYDEIEEE